MAFSLFKDEGFDFDAKGVPGSAAYGVADRQVLATVSQIKEGANAHCEPLATQLRNEREFHWLDGILMQGQRVRRGVDF